MDITNGLTLSRAIKDKATPLRQYLQSRFPDTKPLQNEYKALTGELIIDTYGAPAGTVGTALDILVRFILNPDDVPQSALILFPLSTTYQDVIRELSDVAGSSVRSGDQENLIRAVWGLALCVEAYRAGPLYAPFVPELVRGGKFTLSTMLAQATPQALTEMGALRETADRELIPHLKAPIYLGPEFDSSKRTGLADNRLIAAEADLIANGLLLDIKSQLGTKNSKGIRTDALTVDNLYQLIAYALLDHSDEYKISALGIYSARYGCLAQWQLDYITSTLAGESIDFTLARNDIWKMMNG